MMDRDTLRRAMAEAAALPADDPLREDVVAKVREAGRWAEEEWLALIGFDERLRIELPNVEVPGGLHERLLAVPAAAPAGKRRPGRALGPVAAALAFLAVLVAVWLPLGDPEEPGALDEIASLAVEDHLGQPKLTVRSEDPAEVRAALAQADGLPVRLPALGPGYRLQGGRICRFGQHPVVYTKWQWGGRSRSLYQFRLEDFGLPRDLADRDLLISPSSPTLPAQRVLIFSDGVCGYALVFGNDSKAPSGKAS